MNKIKGHYYAWSKTWIEFKAPNAEGVYSIRDNEGNVIFIGKGNIRRCLLSHWNREHSTDATVWNHNPHSFGFELIDHPADREAEMIRELKPICRQTSHSRFLKFWRTQSVRLSNRVLRKIK